jgi:hypothetical protein
MSNRLVIPAFEGRQGKPWIFKTRHHPDDKKDRKSVSCGWRSRPRRRRPFFSPSQQRLPHARRGPMEQQPDHECALDPAIQKRTFARPQAATVPASLLMSAVWGRAPRLQSVPLRDRAECACSGEPKRLISRLVTDESSEDRLPLNASDPLLTSISKEQAGQPQYARL